MNRQILFICIGIVIAAIAGFLVWDIYDLGQKKGEIIQQQAAHLMTPFLVNYY